MYALLVARVSPWYGYDYISRRACSTQTECLKSISTSCNKSSKANATSTVLCSLGSKVIRCEFWGVDFVFNMAGILPYGHPDFNKRHGAVWLHEHLNQQDELVLNNYTQAKQCNAWVPLYFKRLLCSVRMIACSYKSTVQLEHHSIAMLYSIFLERGSPCYWSLCHILSSCFLFKPSTLSIKSAVLHKAQEYKSAALAVVLDSWPIVL